MVKNVELKTLNGKLRGSRQSNCLGQDYYAFKGIPYAKPPIGPLRFSDPEPMEPWTGVRDALNFGSRAVQSDRVSGKFGGSEDCLYLNVYTRSLDIDARMPVMFWIHGGSFLIGSGDDDNFGPDYLLTKDVVLVTCNYRLGVFGFLNLDDEVASGNQGLKDQTMALRWVNTHIQHFGGDSDNITIFGGSAGATSVHYLALSPLAKGLFHKVICQSGSVFNPWAMMDQATKSLHEFLEVLGCKAREPKVILEFLRKTDSYKLIEAQHKLSPDVRWMRIDYPFGISIDKKSSKVIVSTEPFVFAEKGIQVPCLIGYNSFEGILGLLYLKSIDIEDMDNYTKKYFSERSKKMLKEKYNLTVQDLRKFYMGSEKITEENMKKFSKFRGDVVFNEGMHRLAEIQCRVSSAPTYFYKLTFDKNLSLSKCLINTPIKGVNHGDELTYLFRMKACEAVGLKHLQSDSGADRVMKQMIELWTNFAKYGRPTVTTSELIPIYWQPLINGDIIRYMNIGEELRMEKMLNFKHVFSFKENVL